MANRKKEFELGIPKLGEHLKKLSEMTPEEKAAWSANIVKRIEEQRKDDEDRRLHRGKHDPKHVVLGKCVICGGGVVESLDTEFVGERRIGGRADVVTVHESFYCKECGIQYQFPPKPIVYENLRAKHVSNESHVLDVLTPDSEDGDE